MLLHELGLLFCLSRRARWKQVPCFFGYLVLASCATLQWDWWNFSSWAATEPLLLIGRFLVTAEVFNLGTRKLSAAARAGVLGIALCVAGAVLSLTWTMFPPFHDIGLFLVARSRVYVGLWVVHLLVTWIGAGKPWLRWHSWLTCGLFFSRAACGLIDRFIPADDPWGFWGSVNFTATVIACVLCWGWAKRGMPEEIVKPLPPNVVILPVRQKPRDHRESGGRGPYNEGA